KFRAGRPLHRRTFRGQPREARLQRLRRPRRRARPRLTLRRQRIPRGPQAPAAQHRKAMLRNLLIVLAAIGSRAALAHPNSEPPPDDISPPPPTYKGNGVAVDEHLGAKVPLDATFRTQDGKLVTLGELVTGE